VSLSVLFSWTFFQTSPLVGPVAIKRHLPFPPEEPPLHSFPFFYARSSFPFRPGPYFEQPLALSRPSGTSFRATGFLIAPHDLYSISKYRTLFPRPHRSEDPSFRGRHRWQLGVWPQLSEIFGAVLSA